MIFSFFFPRNDKKWSSFCLPAGIFTSGYSRWRAGMTDKQFLLYPGKSSHLFAADQKKRNFFRDFFAKQGKESIFKEPFNSELKE